MPTATPRANESTTIADSARRLLDADLTKEQRAELEKLLARIDRTPITHTVKGMYVNGVIMAMKSMGTAHPTQRIHAFRDYPLRDFMALLLEAAAALYPRRSLSEGLRALGEQAIPVFAQSIAGGVVMATVGRSWDVALRMVSRGYEVSLKPGKATVAEISENHALVQLRNVWNFGDTYHVGVITGLMHWCGVEGTVTPTVLSPAHTDIRIDCGA